MNLMQLLMQTKRLCPSANAGLHVIWNVDAFLVEARVIKEIGAVCLVGVRSGQFTPDRLPELTDCHTHADNYRRDGKNTCQSGWNTSFPSLWMSQKW